MMPDPTGYEKAVRYWRPHFLWIPRRVDGMFCWLMWVERRWNTIIGWEYRFSIDHGYGPPAYA